MAGCLAWPTTGAEVRPWFLFPQRWPLPPPGPLPVPRDPGCDPLSLHARLESISLFLSSDFIISFSSFFSSNPVAISVLVTCFSGKIFQRMRKGWKVREGRHTPTENKFQIHCGGSFILTFLFQEARSLWEFPLCTARNPLNVSVDHNFFSFLLFSFPTCSQTAAKLSFQMQLS